MVINELRLKKNIHLKDETKRMPKTSVYRVALLNDVPDVLFTIKNASTIYTLFFFLLLTGT